MTQATDTDIRDIKTSIEANTKAIGDLTSSVSSLREEIRVGFANVATQITRLDGKIDNLEIKLDSKIDKLEIKIDGKIDKLDGKFDTVNTRLTNVETNTRNLLDLAEKIGELKNWKQIAIVVFTASVSGAIAWYIRSGNQ